jgi:L-asparaginase / beta-aspartyl-peptidase
MKVRIFAIVIALFIASIARADYALIIHGGAGIEKGDFTPAEENQIRETMKQAALKGKQILSSGGTSLDAVEGVIRMLEDAPLFNAGKGAVFTNAGTNELDAAIMDGSNLKAGAVAGVTHIKNPISLARLVMEKSKHVLLAREGAEAFAKENGVSLVDPKYFFTEKRWQQLEKAKAEEKEKNQPAPVSTPQTQQPRKELGTVGVVALDTHGNIAAGTSTGGLTNKRFGRIGDSPIIGAGTYANNLTCGVSASGTGEYFIRSVAAYDVSALMEYKGLTVQQSAEQVIDKITKMGGDGGLIALDSKGHVIVRFNTPGMTTAYLDANKNPVVHLYKEEFTEKMP